MVTRSLAICAFMAVLFNVPSFADELVIDGNIRCEKLMAGAIPTSIDTKNLVSIANWNGVNLIYLWNEFLTVPHSMIENKLKLGTKIVIATKMPFEADGGELYNPGCWAANAKKILLSGKFVEFSFDHSKPQRSPVAVAILLHELGHAFSDQQKLGIELSKAPKAYELFADFFAGYMFFFWRKFVDSSLNKDHPKLKVVIEAMSSFQSFGQTFRYFGCFMEQTVHGNFDQRVDAFKSGLLTAESTKRENLMSLSLEQVDQLAAVGTQRALAIAKDHAPPVEAGTCNYKTEK